MAGRCVSEPGLLVSAVSGLALTGEDGLFTESPVEGATATRLQENRTLGPWPAPLLLAWGSEDEVIPAELQHDYLARLCSEGIEPQWREYPGASHMGALEPETGLVPALMEWTTDRLTGSPDAGAACCP